MDAHLKLRAQESIIGSVADFTFKWCLNAGFDEEDAARLTLAVDELVTDIVLFAYDEAGGELEITYRWQQGGAEISIHELGEPFDPDRHRYDRTRALRDGHFEGAGFELIRHMVDAFVFVNQGRAGKSFKMVKNVGGAHIAEQPPAPEAQPETAPAARPPEAYHLQDVTPAMAEDVAKLIYRTYGHTYIKDDLYFPKKITRALERGDKFGVLARTASGRAVGYFAVLRTTDARVGEVGEAVVSPRHRRRGLMTLMLRRLIEQARQRDLVGLFGEAVTVHTYSQRANHRFHFRSTALLLGLFPAAKFRDLDEDYPQDLSVIIDYLPLSRPQTVRCFLPERYAALLHSIYQALDQHVAPQPHQAVALPERGVTELHVRFAFQHALIVVKTYGADLASYAAQQVHALADQGVEVVFIDLPLDHPATPAMAEALHRQGFILAGLMPAFHQDRDHLRLQSCTKALDFSLIAVYTDLAHQIKATIEEEYRCLTTKTATA